MSSLVTTRKTSHLDCDCILNLAGSPQTIARTKCILNVIKPHYLCIHIRTKRTRPNKKLHHGEPWSWTLHYCLLSPTLCGKRSHWPHQQDPRNYTKTDKFTHKESQHYTRTPIWLRNQRKAHKLVLYQLNVHRFCIPFLSQLRHHPSQSPKRDSLALGPSSCTIDLLHLPIPLSVMLAPGHFRVRHLQRNDE